MAAASASLAARIGGLMAPWAYLAPTPCSAEGLARAARARGRVRAGPGTRGVERAHLFESRVARPGVARARAAGARDPGGGLARPRSARTGARSARSRSARGRVAGA